MKKSELKIDGKALYEKMQTREGLVELEKLGIVMRHSCPDCGAELWGTDTGSASSASNARCAACELNY